MSLTIFCLIKASIEEREKLQSINSLLHHKLADYFRKKKSEEAQNQSIFDKSTQEQEQRYLKYLGKYSTNFFLLNSWSILNENINLIDLN